MPAPIILPILSIFKSAGLNQARQALLGASKDFSSLAGTIGQAAGAFAAFNALTSARQFTLESVELTQRYERNLLALQQVFEQMTPQMRMFSKEVEAYGLSQSQAAQASVFLGSVLKQYGFSVEESASQTQRLVKLAQDLAVTYGYDVQEALLAITALFRGEYDPIEKFGVAMKQNEVNAEVAARGLGNLTGAALANAQATARLDMLFSRAGDSIGAFTRAADTLYAAQQRLRAGVENLQVAFGAPLQEPLAALQNSFADLIDEQGPGIVDIGYAIGQALDQLGPTISLLAELLLQVIQPVEQLIQLLATLLEAAFIPVNVVLEALIIGFEKLNYMLDALSILFGQLGSLLDSFVNSSGAAFLDWLKQVSEDSVIIGFLIDLGDEINTATKRFEDWVDQQRNNEFTYSSRDLAMLNNAIRNYNVEVVAAAEATVPYIERLKDLGVYSEDAEGNLSGLAGIFTELDTAAQKSNAADELERMGFNASQIEYFLTKPDWYEIFSQIGRLAKLAAYDLATLPAGAVGAAAAIANAKDAFKELLDSTFGGASPSPEAPKKAAKDFVKAFTNGIRDEAEKNSARTQLSALGASTGLIEKILNTDGWKKVWLSIKNGTLSVEELQRAFNATADGAKELKDAATEAAEAADERLQAALALFKEQQEAIARQVEAIRELESELKQVSVLDMLPSQAELGRYEQNVVDQFGNIREALKKAFDNKAILKDAYDNLMAYAAQEQAVLQGIARQRDDVLRRYDLAKALIEQYQGVFRNAVNLNSMLSSLETKAKKVTVTQFSEGLVKMRDGLKEFKVTLSREYEEEIKDTINKSQGLVTKFQEIAVKARAFAENLRKLRDMGLNGQLFNQLVQAGVEAGGETAQALVDGGKDTINEVNNLFQEIDSLGSTLGEEVARSLYGDGVDMGKGLLDGLLSLATQFENAGITLANSFTSKFNDMVTGAVAAAIASLQNIVAPGTNGTLEIQTGYDSMGMPQVILAPDIPIQMPQAIIVSTPEGDQVTNPFTPRPGGSPFPTTTININVRTDATQSNAMVGKQLGSIITSYVETGGLVAI